MQTSPLETVLRRLESVTGKRPTKSGDGFKAICPAHPDRNPSLSVRANEDGNVGLKCWALCTPEAVVEALGLKMRDLFATPSRPATPPRKTTAADGFKRILAASNADTGRIAAYLRFRGLTGDVPAVLRLHPGLRYIEDGKTHGTFATMIAPVVKGNKLVAIHRTYLDPKSDGKAPVPQPKKLLGQAKGGAIQLAAATGTILAIAEGIETSLAVSHATGTLCWSALSAGNMPEVDVPEHVKVVEVWGDPGPAGERAAEETARRHHAAGRIVYVLIASEGGDWLDTFVADGPEKLRRARADAVRWMPAKVQEDTDDEEEPTETNAEEEDYFDEKGRFIPARLGAGLMAEAPIFLGYDRRLWRYDAGVYRPDGDDWARLRVRTVVGERFRRNQMEEVAAWLRAQLASLGHHPPVEYINCKNGLLDWRSGVLHPHSPDVLSTNQIPVAWNPDATAPTVAKFLSEVLEADAIQLIEELAGYAMYAGNPFRKAVLLYGPGGNGKSTLLRLITSLLGKENVASVALQALSENRFAAADVFGKLANVCGDLDARAIHHTDLFKQITGGDPINAERKFHDAFSFVSYALPLFSANEFPRTADQTAAWFDRWIIIEMPRRFEGTSEEDAHLSAQLATELEGFFVLAVQGLQRLMARGRFHLPPSVQRTSVTYRQIVDTVQGFVAEQCHVDPSGWVDKAELYRQYKAWCSEGGRLYLAAANFNSHLLQTAPGVVFPRKRRGRPGWLGLAFGGDEGDEGDAISIYTYRGDLQQVVGEEVGGEMRISGKPVPLVPPIPPRPPAGEQNATILSSREPAGMRTREPGEDDVDEVAPCRVCRGRDFWQQSPGTWICATCHPAPVRREVGAR